MNALGRISASATTLGRRAMSSWHKPAIAVEFDGVKQCRAEDTIVNITFVNYSGVRKTLPAMVGDTLLDVARRYHYKFVDGACNGGAGPKEVFHEKGSWFEPKYGEGPVCNFCHVILPKSHYDAVPPKFADELNQLQQYPFPEDVSETSRLACQVVVNEKMEGMVVYIPDGPSSDFV